MHVLKGLAMRFHTRLTTLSNKRDSDAPQMQSCQGIQFCAYLQCRKEPRFYQGWLLIAYSWSNIPASRPSKCVWRKFRIIIFTNAIDASQIHEVKSVLELRWVQDFEACLQKRLQQSRMASRGDSIPGHSEVWVLIYCTGNQAAQVSPIAEHVGERCRERWCSLNCWKSYLPNVAFHGKTKNAPYLVHGHSTAQRACPVSCNNFVTQCGIITGDQKLISV